MRNTNQNKSSDGGCRRLLLVFVVCVTLLALSFNTLNSSSSSSSKPATTIPPVSSSLSSSSSSSSSTSTYRQLKFMRLHQYIAEYAHTPAAQTLTSLFKDYPIRDLIACNETALSRTACPSSFSSSSSSSTTTMQTLKGLIALKERWNSNNRNEVLLRKHARKFDAIVLLKPQTCFDTLWHGLTDYILPVFAAVASTPQEVQQSSIANDASSAVDMSRYRVALLVQSPKSTGFQWGAENKGCPSMNAYPFGFPASQGTTNAATELMLDVFASPIATLSTTGTTPPAAVTTYFFPFDYDQDVRLLAKRVVVGVPDYWSVFPPLKRDNSSSKNTKDIQLTQAEVAGSLFRSADSNHRSCVALRSVRSRLLLREQRQRRNAAYGSNSNAPSPLAHQRYRRRASGPYSIQQHQHQHQHQQGGGGGQERERGKGDQHDSPHVPSVVLIDRANVKNNGRQILNMPELRQQLRLLCNGESNFSSSSSSSSSSKGGGSGAIFDDEQEQEESTKSSTGKAEKNKKNKKRKKCNLLYVPELGELSLQQQRALFFTGAPASSSSSGGSKTTESKNIFVMARGAGTVNLLFAAPGSHFVSLYPSNKTRRRDETQSSDDDDDAPEARMAKSSKIRREDEDDFPWWPFPCFLRDIQPTFVPCASALAANNNFTNRQAKNCWRRSVNYCDMRCDTFAVVSAVHEALSKRS